MWDRTGENQVYVRQQIAAEEQKRFGKELALSRTPPERSLRQFTTSVKADWRLLPFRVVAFKNRPDDPNALPVCNAIRLNLN